MCVLCVCVCVCVCVVCVCVCACVRGCGAELKLQDPVFPSVAEAISYQKQVLFIALGEGEGRCVYSLITRIFCEVVIFYQICDRWAIGVGVGSGSGCGCGSGCYNQPAICHL